MDWSSDKIVETVEQLRKDSCYKNGDEIMEIYGEFRDKFPKLFYTCLSPDFNMDELRGLLNIRETASRTGTPDIIRDTQVGEVYAKRYIYPVTREPSMADKKLAAKKVAEKYVELDNASRSAEHSDRSSN
jgi:hypothetical protein